MATRITVFEGDRLDTTFGSRLSRPVSRLLDTKVGGKRAFTLRNGSIYANDLVGAVDVGELKVEVLPKPFGVNSVGEGRRLLFELLSWAGTEISPSWMDGGSSTRHKDVLEIVEQSAAKELLRRLEVAVPRRYHEVAERTSVLRGRIDFAQYSRQLPANAHILPIRHFPFEADNELARLLKALATTLRNRSRSFSTRRVLDRCLDLLASVRELPLTLDLVSRVRVDRVDAEWGRLVEFANLLAVGSSPDPTGLGSTDQATLLFSMNNLFEKAIRRALSDFLLDPVSCLRSSGEHALLATSSGQGNSVALRVRPDLLFCKYGKVLAPGDAKWKRLIVDSPRFGIVPGDFYQILTYMRLFQSQVGLLFFPRMEWMAPNWTCEFSVSPFGQERIIVASVELHELVAFNRANEGSSARHFATQVQKMLLP